MSGPARRETPGGGVASGPRALPRELPARVA
jgi:hypothetical protein